MPFKRLIDQLSTKYVERHEAIAALVAAVIARRHVVLIGPPGTAKTSLIRDLAAGMGGLRFFSWLLTEFSVPEELFGPLDIAALEKGQYRRLASGKLPEAEIAFIDEVFKAGPAILNTLLSILQERLFYNDSQPVQCPLFSLIGASNETPTDQELEALWDRFTVRLQVGYIREPANFVSMLTGCTSQMAQILDRADLVAAQEAAARVTVPAAMLDTVVRLRQALSEQGIVASDRRYKESLDLLRAAAFLDGRDEVTEDDLLILQHVLWHDPAQAREVARLVFAVAEPLLMGIAEIEDEALSAVNEARQAITAGSGSGTAQAQVLLNAVGNLREAVKKLESLEDQVAGRPRAKAALEETVQRVRSWQAEVLKALGV